ncbi:Delta-tubulin (Tubulin delta chain) [Durusdinium trenchii]|uniref:Delta-tubulin (Tubulin delta chain) n=1 Tax=Durusdinium trenchii TaxID=1381693 RepID=A0ABP0RP03_9DINO
MSFAANLTKIVAGKKSELADREKIAQSWKEKEATLLDEAVNLFKARCVKEAELQKTEATISFEVITREIPDFPKRILTDSTYFVDSWPSGTTAESWFYATRGVNSSWSPGAPILFAEVLQAMLPKFVDRVKELGFQECNHEAGTWKVAVSWPPPEESSEKKKRRRE